MAEGAVERRVCFVLPNAEMKVNAGSCPHLTWLLEHESTPCCKWVRSLPKQSWHFSLPPRPPVCSDLFLVFLGINIFLTEGQWGCQVGYWSVWDGFRLLPFFLCALKSRGLRARPAVGPRRAATHKWPEESKSRLSHVSLSEGMCLPAWPGNMSKGAPASVS